MAGYEEDSRASVRRLAASYRQRAARRAKEQARIERLLVEEKKLWRQGVQWIAGIDEAGRGPLAGPVYAAACVLPEKFALPGLNDSKKLSESRREQLFREIQEQALFYSVSSADAAEIDRLNILEASKLAMQRAVAALAVAPQYLLIDAVSLSAINIPQLALIGGDGLSASIAAASILAKVSRDRFMHELHQQYPAYGFDKHKGYPTLEHRQALARLGVCPFHRRTYAPVREILSGGK
ncbi:MAG: ribonuclease HII [Peptococcaceae bacterium]|nr:ribonuclease HII [Peptococcaceae bacterium]